MNILLFFPPTEQLRSYSKIYMYSFRLVICFSVSSPSDVVTIDKTAENFRLLYDVKGRFTVHRMMTEEAKVCSFQTTIHVEVVPSTQHIHTRMHARTHTHTHTHCSTSWVKSGEWLWDRRESRTA